MDLLTDQEGQNVIDSCHSENIDSRNRVQVGLNEKRKGRQTKAEICRSLSNIEHQSCTLRSRLTKVPINTHNPRQVGDGEIGIDARAYVEELTHIVFGRTSSKEQGKSRKSTEEAHTASESSNRSYKRNVMGREVGNVDRVDGLSYSPGNSGRRKSPLSGSRSDLATKLCVAGARLAMF